MDQYSDPLKLWWDDDCLEIFIDEDNSGGDHQYNHNAFAYHVDLDGNVVDMSTERTGKLGYKKTHANYYLMDFEKVRGLLRKFISK